MFWTLPCALQVTPIKVERCRDERFVKARRVNPKNFFAELKRRNVYKVAIAYAIIAWLLMQIATQVFPFLEIPNWAIRLVIMLIVIGFPIALVIAWAFELTPEGLKRTEDVDLSKSITRKTGRKLDFFIIAVLLLVIGVLLFQRLRPNVSPAVSSSGEKYRGAIFERFSQIHNQDRRGIGLGLYIAKMMVEEHPGRIWVESKLGEGSTFHFTLPLRSGAIREAGPQ